MNKTVALDIGGVCINLHYDRCYDYFGYSKAKPAPPALLTITEQFERGLITETDWLEHFRSLLTEDSGRDWSYDEIRCGWNLIIGNDIAGMAEWITMMLNAGYHFIYFSDTSPLHLADVKEKFSASHLVEGGIFSFKVKAKKPEPAMYEAFEAEYGRPALYLDDKPENIAAAQKRGWPAQIFTDVNHISDIGRAIDFKGI